MIGDQMPKMVLHEPAPDAGLCDLPCTPFKRSGRHVHRSPAAMVSDNCLVRKIWPDRSPISQLIAETKLSRRHDWNIVKRDHRVLHLHAIVLVA
jgi:hypothetical protein